MATSSQQGWEVDRERFVAAVRGRVPWQRQPGRSQMVADERSRLWSPLSREFAGVARDLFAARTVGDVLGRIVHATHSVAPGAELASITLHLPEHVLRTPAYTAPLAVELDQIQHRYQQGPFDHATRPGGTGFVNSPDLGREAEWRQFGPAVVTLGLRSVASTGIFPDGPAGRVGSLNLYSREPRGLATLDQDVVLVLASHAATALSTTTAATEEAINATPVPIPLRSTEVLSNATQVLLDRRHLPPGDAYDVLRRAAQRLAEDLRA